MPGEWLTRAFGAAIGDVRDHLVLEAWFGSAARPTPPSKFDRVLDEKLYPGQIGERGFLGWLEAGQFHDPAQKPEPEAPDRGIDR